VRWGRVERVRVPSAQLRAAKCSNIHSRWSERSPPRLCERLVGGVAERLWPHRLCDRWQSTPLKIQVPHERGGVGWGESAPIRPGLLHLRPDGRGAAPQRRRGMPVRVRCRSFPPRGGGGGGWRGPDWPRASDSRFPSLIWNVGWREVHCTDGALLHRGPCTAPALPQATWRFTRRSGGPQRC
jgi:hypothetical protein